MLQTYGYWPLHSRDAIICPNCHRPVVSFEQGRPDLLVLSPTWRTAVIEVKAVNLEHAKSFAFADIKPEQRRWLDAWKEAGGYGFIAIGTVGTTKRQIWIIDWLDWLGLETLAGQAGKKSVSIDRLTADYSVYELERITGGWRFATIHSLVPPEN